MSSSNLSAYRQSFIQTMITKLLAKDIASASDADLLLQGAMLKMMSSVSSPSADQEISDLFGYAITSNYVGVAYNRATDTFIRLGASGSQPIGALMNMTLSPVFSRLRRVVLTDAGLVYAGISWTNKTLHDDGSAVSLQGANGQIMVEYLPGYYKAGEWGDWAYLLLSHLPLSGFSLHPLFTGYSAVYRGAYEGSIYNGKLCSISLSPADGTSPVYPVTTRSGTWGHASLTTQATDTLATARGTGWQQEDLLTAEWERMLMLVGYASYDIPSIVGAGRVNVGGDWVDGSLIGKCGLSNASAGYASAVQNGGTSGQATDYSHVLGIENPWGNVWKRVASLISDGAVYYKSAPPYDYSTVSGWTRLQDALGNNITLPQNHGWAGTPHSGRGMVMPKDVTGSSSTKMRNYYWYIGGLRVLLAGGASNNGANAGPFSWAANNAASDAHASVGGRLCFKKAA